MADRLFDRLEQEAFRAGIQARTQQSMTWFLNQFMDSLVRACIPALKASCSNLSNNL